MPKPPPAPFYNVLTTLCTDVTTNKLVAKALWCVAAYRSPEKYLSAALKKGCSIEAEVLGGLLSLSRGAAGGITEGASRMVRLLEAAGPGQEEAVVRCREVLEALRLWAGGNMRQAVRHAEQRVLRLWPLDFLTLRIVCDAHIILGQSAEYLEIVKSVEPHWKKAAEGQERRVQEYGFILGMLAFGLQENGFTNEARAAARKSLRMGVRDAWGVHAVAHSFCSDGKPAQGLQYLNATAGIWQEADLLAGHIWWHSAVFHLDVGRPRRALSVYDRHLVSPNASEQDIPTTAFALADAAGLLWRLYLMGHDVTTRARVVVRGFLRGGHDTANVWLFTTCHVMIAAVLCHDEALQKQLLSHKAVAQGGDSAIIQEDAGDPINQAVAAHAKGDHARVVALMKDTDTTLIGGSIAQRDTFDMTLLDSAVRSGDPLADKLSRTRVTSSPYSPLSWLMRANAAAKNASGGAFDRSTMSRRPVSDAARTALELENEANRSILGASMYSLARRWTRKRSSRTREKLRPADRAKL